MVYIRNKTFEMYVIHAEKTKETRSSGYIKDAYIIVWYVPAKTLSTQIIGDSLTCGFQYPTFLTVQSIIICSILISDLIFETRYSYLDKPGLELISLFLSLSSNDETQGPPSWLCCSQSTNGSTLAHRAYNLLSSVWKLVNGSAMTRRIKKKQNTHQYIGSQTPLPIYQRAALMRVTCVGH